MAINDQLKFTWGHIIAFLAIIVISYFSFMGISYLTNGNFVCAGIGVFVIDLLLIVYFIIPQLLKGTDHKFNKKIPYERVMVFTAPLVFAVLMIPYTHFWNVLDEQDNVQKSFKEAVEYTNNLFVSYEEYANKRIEYFQPRHSEITTNLEYAELEKRLKKEALQIQLLAGNYEKLKGEATSWIENAASSSVWNVFVLGNISKVGEAIDTWNENLASFSQNLMDDEATTIPTFVSPHPNASNAKITLNNLRVIYTNLHWPPVLAIVLAFVFYFLLMLPYLIQARNTKNHNRLIGTKAVHATPDEIEVNLADETNQNDLNAGKANLNDEILSNKTTTTTTKSKYKSFTI